MRGVGESMEAEGGVVIVKTTREGSYYTEKPKAGAVLHPLLLHQR